MGVLLKCMNAVTVYFLTFSPNNVNNCNFLSTTYKNVYIRTCNQLKYEYT